MHLISQGIKPKGAQFSAESWHRYLCERFLGAEEVTLPNGNTRIVPHGSSDLDVTEFNEFMAKCEHFAGENGVWLED